MEREIFFRCKDKKGEWIYCNYSDDIMMANIEVEPHTVGQYTGLADKNGIGVFEGDIVLTDGLINTKVVWDAGRLMWCLEYPKGEKVALSLFEKWDIEVVGNVFEDSELLGG